MRTGASPRNPRIHNPRSPNRQSAHSFAAGARAREPRKCRPESPRAPSRPELGARWAAAAGGLRSDS
eukprot:3788669-Alexandrium_andersonii.AAC.1